ncbi:hypothetical protein [Spirochaeta dissipatitropha]
MTRIKNVIPKHEIVNGYLVRLEDLSFDQAEAVMSFKQRNPRLGFGEIALLLGYVDRVRVDEPAEEE